MLASPDEEILTSIEYKMRYVVDTIETSSTEGKRVSWFEAVLLSEVPNDGNIQLVAREEKRRGPEK